jgi:hypothetical protein
MLFSEEKFKKKWIWWKGLENTVGGGRNGLKGERGLNNRVRREYILKQDSTARRRRRRCTDRRTDEGGVTNLNKHFWYINIIIISKILS